MARKLKPGAAGWIATGLVILTAELVDKRTMSDAFYALSKDPRGRYVVVPTWAYLTAHLFGMVPRKYDPLCLLWATVKGSNIELADLPEAQL